VLLRAPRTGFRKLLNLCQRVLSRPKLQIRLQVVFSTVDVGLCGGFRFLVSGCTTVDFVVGGGFRGFRFLGRPVHRAVKTTDENSPCGTRLLYRPTCLRCQLTETKLIFFDIVYLHWPCVRSTQHGQQPGPARRAGRAVHGTTRLLAASASRVRRAVCL